MELVVVATKSISDTGLSTVHLPSTIVRGTPITFVMASLSHLSCCSILLTSRALITPSAVPTKHSALLFLTPSHTIWGSFYSTVLRRLLSPAPSVRMAQTLVFAYCHAIFRMAPVSTLLTPGQDAPRMLHQPRQDWGVFSDFFWRAALHMALDGSDDTA